MQMLLFSLFFVFWVIIRRHSRQMEIAKTNPAGFTIKFERNFGKLLQNLSEGSLSQSCVRRLSDKVFFA